MVSESLYLLLQYSKNMSLQFYNNLIYETDLNDT